MTSDPKTPNRQIPADLLQRLIWSRDIWHIRAATLATVLEARGIAAADILEGDKEYCLSVIERMNNPGGEL